MCAKKNIKNLEIRPDKKGLYDPEFEKDSCGVGLVATLKAFNLERLWMMPTS